MPKFDTYQEVTDAIVAKLEAGTLPWRCDWSRAGGTLMPHRANGIAYRGINILLLWAAYERTGFRGRHWMTFNQALELGGAVRKGEKSTRIVFFKALDKTETNDAGEEVERRIPMLRTYNVFNSDQVDGLPDRFAPEPLELIGGKARDEANEAALRSSGAQIREGGVRAYYSPSEDFVQMPDFDRFESTSGYLATLAHELCHWTGHASRNAREFGGSFGDKRYAFEELVAELGAAFIGARLGIVGEHIDNHAAYLGSWLKGLKEDKRAIFRAASLAQAAADLVLANSAAASPAEPIAQPEPVAAERGQLALAI